MQCSSQCHLDFEYLEPSLSQFKGSDIPQAYNCLTDFIFYFLPYKIANEQVDSS